MEHPSSNSMAISATLHCLTGCAIGEILGLILSTIFGWSNLPSVALAISLSFVFGYSLSSIPLLQAGMPIKQALLTVLAADSLSILTMEIVDNTVEMLIPGAMAAGLVNPLFWGTLPLSLGIAFFAAVPVNKYLLSKGKGHALTHKYHGH